MMHLVRQLFSVVTAVILYGCSSSNNVVIVLTQGQCVQSYQYSLPVTPPSAILKNPNVAPYCMSVTLQNNNHNHSANNVLVVNQGVTLSFTANNQNLSGILYDPIAAQLTVTGQTQSVGNVTIYDPNNCATNQGAQVSTLYGNGGTCTFYLQLSSEAYSVGTYPMTLTYNYTNGNANYSVSTVINQRVNLYAGTHNGAAMWSNGIWQQFNQDLAGLPIVNTATDIFGNVYFATTSVVYRYNGLTLSALSGISATISGITTDSNGYLYAATDHGVFRYNGVWSAFNDLNNTTITHTTVLTGIKANYSNNYLYATSESLVYLCSNVNSSNSGCLWSQQISSGAPLGPISNNNSLAVDTAGNFYVSYGDQLSRLNTSQVWESYSVTPNISGVLTNVTYANGYLYLGGTPSLLTNSIVYSCAVSGNTCDALLSSSSAALNGASLTIAVDAGSNLYVGGSSLSSTDFSGNLYSTYLPMSSSGSLWQLTDDGAINAPIVSLSTSSMLTSY